MAIPAIVSRTRVIGLFRDSDGRRIPGQYTSRLNSRITVTGDPVTIVPKGRIPEATGDLETEEPMSLDISLPATDAPEVLERGWGVVLVVDFCGARKDEVYVLDKLPAGGTLDLADVVPINSETAEDLDPSIIIQAGRPGPGATITTWTLDTEGNTLITWNDGTTVTVQRGLPGGGGTGAGITITSSSIDADGNTEILFSDGSTVIVQHGEPGAPGKPGNPGADAAPLTVTSQAVNAQGGTDVTLSDGTTFTVARGAPGAPGSPGTPAAPLTVISQTTNAQGGTDVTLSDGTTFTVARGAPGAPGSPGTPGNAGPANTLSIGTVTVGTAGASLTGASPNQTLNLVLPTADPQDTGLRLLYTDTYGIQSTIQRIGRMVTVRAIVAVNAPSFLTSITVDIPSGFRMQLPRYGSSSRAVAVGWGVTNSSGTPIRVDITSSSLSFPVVAGKENTVSLVTTYMTKDDWPTTLPTLVT